MILNEQHIKRLVRNVLFETVSAKRLLTEGQADKVLKRYIENNMDSHFKPYLNSPLSEIPSQL